MTRSEVRAFVESSSGGLGLLLTLATGYGLRQALWQRSAPANAHL